MLDCNWCHKPRRGGVPDGHNSWWRVYYILHFMGSSFPVEVWRCNWGFGNFELWLLQYPNYLTTFLVLKDICCTT